MIKEIMEVGSSIKNGKKNINKNFKYWQNETFYF